MLLSERKKDFIFFALSAILGLASFMIPAVLTPGYIKRHYDPFYPILSMILGPEIIRYLGLAITGFIIGFLNPKHPWRWGLATMSLFPILAIIEMVVDPYSHNLWPFEFLMYGVLTVPGILGAITGAFIRKKLKR